MASVPKVQAYLAYWFQLGKPVVFQNSQTECLPQPIFQGTQFSDAFEQCWQRIFQNPSDCYLSGTDETIGTLLSDEWEIVGCARCPMPVPMPVRGIKLSPCPCMDLPSWPNDQVPMPRSGINTTDYLDNIRQRLNTCDQSDYDRLQSAYSHSPSFPKTPVDPSQAFLPRTPSERPLPDAR